MAGYLFSNRSDVFFEQGSHATTYKWWMEDEQTKDLQGGAKASASSKLGGVADNKVALALELKRNVSEGDGNLRFELIMPMLVKSIALSEQELQTRLKEGEYLCHKVMLGAKATGTIKRNGSSSYEHSVSAKGNVSGPLSAEGLGGMSGGGQVAARSKSHGPKQFAMEVQLEGGPSLMTNKQGNTTNELLNWFEKEWKNKVAKSPEKWKVLRVHVHGDFDQLEKALEEGKDEEQQQSQVEEAERKEQQQEARDEALRKAIIARYPNKADILKHQLAGKPGEELEHLAEWYANKHAECRLALEKAMVVTDFDKLLEATAGFRTVAGADNESMKLLNKADGMARIQQEPSRLKKELDAARNGLKQVLSKLPDVDHDVVEYRQQAKQSGRQQEFWKQEKQSEDSRRSSPAPLAALTDIAVLLDQGFPPHKAHDFDTPAESPGLWEKAAAQATALLPPDVANYISSVNRDPANRTAKSEKWKDRGDMDRHMTELAEALLAFETAKSNYELACEESHRDFRQTNLAEGYFANQKTLNKYQIDLEEDRQACTKKFPEMMSGVMDTPGDVSHPENMGEALLRRSQTKELEGGTSLVLEGVGRGAIVVQGKQTLQFLAGQALHPTPQAKEEGCTLHNKTW